MADVPPPPDGIEGFDAPPPPDGVHGFDAPPPPDGVEGFDAPPPPEGVEGFDAPSPPDGVQGFDAPPPPDGVEGFDAPPPPDGVEGFDAPPPPDGGVGSDVSPPPDGVEGFDAPPSTEGVVGSDALLSTPDDQGPDLPTQASPPDSDISSLPEENAEFDSGLDLDPTDELDVPAVAEGAGAAELVDEETPDLQDSPSADVKSKDEFTPQDGIPMEEPSSASQSEPAHANAPRRNRKPALLALALAVGGAAWAITQTGSDGDTGAGNSEVANFADEEEPTTSTAGLAEEAPSTTIAGPNEEATTTLVSESDEEVPTTTIDEADTSEVPSTSTGVDSSSPSSGGTGSGSERSVTVSGPDLPSRVVVGQSFPWSFSATSTGTVLYAVGGPMDYELECTPAIPGVDSADALYQFSWEGTCVSNTPGIKTHRWYAGGSCTTGAGGSCVSDERTATIETVDPSPSFDFSTSVRCDHVLVSYEIDAPTYGGLIEWSAAVEWNNSTTTVDQEYPIAPAPGSLRIPIESELGQKFVVVRLEHNVPNGRNLWRTGDYVYVNSDPVDNGCEPAPTTTTTEPAPTTTTTEPAPTTTSTEPVPTTTTTEPAN